MSNMFLYEFINQLYLKIYSRILKYFGYEPVCTQEPVESNSGSDSIFDFSNYNDSIKKYIDFETDSDLDLDPEPYEDKNEDEDSDDAVGPKSII